VMRCCLDGSIFPISADISVAKKDPPLTLLMRLNHADSLYKFQITGFIFGYKTGFGAGRAPRYRVGVESVSKL
jgi:hypothetical protein